MSQYKILKYKITGSNKRPGKNPISILSYQNPPSHQPLTLYTFTHLYSNPSQAHFQRLKAAYPGRRLLIVSNSAGASSVDPKGLLARAVEASTGIAVLPHATKKPGCGAEIMEYFRAHPETGVTRPEHVAVVGDRLTTDVMMANAMGAYAVWVRDGVVVEGETSMVSLT